MEEVKFIYQETESAEIVPDSEGWEYWSDRIVKNDNQEIIEHVAVWRKIEQ